MNTKAPVTEPARKLSCNLALKWGTLALMLLPPAAQADGVVTECTDAALRTAMAGAGTVTFACDGTINLALTSSTTPTEIVITNDTVLDGTGHQITITGIKRVFNLTSNATFTAINLVIANSYGPSYETPYPHAEPGGGILNDGGTLNLFAVSFLTNTAFIGGAIMNQNGGTVNATNCTFRGNFAGRNMLWGNWNGDAYGGAILNKNGSVNLQTCQFCGNQVAGGPGWGHVSGTPSDAYTGFGGAIHNEGLLTISFCTFEKNSATGGAGDTPPLYPYCNGCPGTSGGSGSGGAICNFGALSVFSSAFFSNSTAGGIAGDGRNGFAGYFDAGPGGAGGAGGSALGGALFNSGTAWAVNSSFYGNTGVGVNGGQAGGGGASDHGSYGGRGGAGGNGGSGFGGICDTNGGLRLTNCTLAFNLATAGSGAPGGLGGPGDYGRAPSGTNGLNGLAAGDLRSTGGLLLNTLLADGSPINSLGSLVDAGHNLSSDASCAFTNVGSLNSTDPKIGPLANNGGPTLTVALLLGSPAIDAADTSAAPATDQRGVSRPIGPSSDIGAFEFGSPPVLLGLSGCPSTGFDIVACAYPGQSVCMLASSNLSDWIPVATNQIGVDGIFVFHDVCAPDTLTMFYRLVVP